MVGVALTVASGGVQHKDFPISDVMKIKAIRVTVEDELLVCFLKYKPVACLAVIGYSKFLRGIFHGEDVCYSLSVELHQPLPEEGSNVSHVDHSRVAMNICGPHGLVDFPQKPWVAE